MDVPAETFAAVKELMERVGPMLESDDPHVMRIDPELFRMLREDALAAGVYIPSEPFAYLDHVRRTSPKPKLRHKR